MSNLTDISKHYKNNALTLQGETIYCHGNEVMVGACGSGRDPDCGFGHFGVGSYTEIQCCDMPDQDVYSYAECSAKYGDYGDDVSCGNELLVEELCGSGRDPDCDGSYTKISCCKGNYGDGTRLVSNGSCVWHYASYGTPLTCTYDDEAIFGICGSGRDPDCDNSSHYHGIQCCKLVRV